MGMTGHGGVDFKRQRKGLAGSGAGDAGWRAGTHGMKEVFKFKTKRFGTRQVEFAEGQTWRWMRLGRGGLEIVATVRIGCLRICWRHGSRWGALRVADQAGIDVDGEKFLPGVVE